MKTQRFKMAAKLIIFVAILVVGFSFGNASAASDPAASALLYTYYDVRPIADGGLGLTDNYFTVTNTGANWVQAHVRVRTGNKSIELLDFDVLLSPKDAFNFDLYMAANGGIEFASCDTHTLENSGFSTNKGCIVLNSETNPNMLSLIERCRGIDAAAALLETQKGYVEVIGEGEIIPDPANVNKCFSWVAPATSQNIPGFNLWNILDVAPGNACVVADIAPMSAVLEGKVFYVTVGSDLSVQRLAYLNAEALDVSLPAWGIGPLAALGVIQHVAGTIDDYTAELARCAAAPDAGCMAYIDAGVAPLSASAAQDMNMCFFKNKIVVANDVINRFGAAASFGPTIADLNVRRNGVLATTGGALNTLSTAYSQFNTNTDMAKTAVAVNKAKADTYYFNVPAPTYTLDMALKVAFIFPFQHFINEVDSITATEAYDTEEGTTTISLSKFISPGLPAPGGAPGEEAQIFSFNLPFPEGWVSFSTTATNETCAVAPADALDNVRCGPATYVPGYTAAAFTSGEGALGVSHLHYR